jgi:hypothetical protein
MPYVRQLDTSLSLWRIWVQSQVTSCEIGSGQSDIGAGFFGDSLLIINLSLPLEMCDSPN